MSSTTARGSRKTRRRPGARGPMIARAPTRKAVSVEIPPGVLVAGAGGDGQEDDGGHHQPRHRGGDWHEGTGPARQLADGELAAHLQPHGEEEDRHEGVVDEGMEGELQGEVLDSENEVGLPEPLVGLVGQVGPGDRRQGGYEQEQGAETGLGHRGDLLGDGVTPTWTNRTLSRRAVDRGGLRGSAPSTTISERKGRSLPLRLDTAVGGPQGNERREAPRHSRRPPKKERGWEDASALPPRIAWPQGAVAGGMPKACSSSSIDVT